MPLFEYRCTGCSHRFEVLVRQGESPTCPRCQGSELEKLLSVFAVGGDHQPARAATPCGGVCSDPRGPGACPLA
ncbi:MAG: zinc ribbon domain-containing protein [Myxococcales bacterium]|nr:zinc ribbon domain-containing protein [Myxococcales bacterium]